MVTWRVVKFQNLYKFLHLTSDTSPLIWYHSPFCKCRSSFCLNGMVPCYCKACARARKKLSVDGLGGPGDECHFFF